MTCYPEIHPSRVHVLHYLFCVLGNGHEWHRGEIVDKSKDSQYARWRERAIPFSKTRLIPHDMRTLEVYPLSDACLLARIPDNVTADWAAAAFETITRLAHQYRNFKIIGGSYRAERTMRDIAMRDTSLVIIQQAAAKLGSLTWR